jgi:hypothetical protein
MSKKTFPDIWISLGKVPVITVTQEWQRQDIAERQKRLTHEIVGHLFMHLRDNIDRIGFYSRPEKDEFSKRLYNKIIANPEKDVPENCFGNKPKLPLHLQILVPRLQAIMDKKGYKITEVSSDEIFKNPEMSGHDIAKILKVGYNGPQLDSHDNFVYHTFTDPITGTTFAGTDLETSRKSLGEARKRFGYKLL